MTEIDVRKLLENTYSTLVRERKPRDMTFPEEVQVVAYEDDFDRDTLTGYLVYRSAGLFQLKNGLWTIAHGRSRGRCLTGKVYSNILAQEIEDPEKLAQEIRSSTYFKNSLVLAKSDGELIFNKDPRFRKTMLEKLVPEVDRFTARKMQQDKKVFSISDGQPVCAAEQTYRPEFAKFLADSIVEVLESKS